MRSRLVTVEQSKFLTARRRARGQSQGYSRRRPGALSSESETLVRLGPVEQGALWSAPQSPPKGWHVAANRVDQLPLRRDQISVKLSSLSSFTSEASSGRTIGSL